MTDTPPASVSLRAPAKINLALAVAPANPSPPKGDGLHPIASWMTAINLCDELTVTKLDADRPSRYAIVWHADAPKQTPIDWSITKDLAVRAHQLLEATVGRPLPVQLKLEKRIPVGAGLAGGSSDAATTLQAVNDLYQLGLARGRLQRMAAKLGSDVAFFLPHEGESTPRPALVQGVGDEIESTPAVTAAGSSGATLALILPPFDCSTPAVYRAFDELAPQPFEAEAACSLARLGEVDDAALFNDLAAPAGMVEPRLATMRSAVEKATGRRVNVTGSGSGLFLVLTNNDTAFIEYLRTTESLQSAAIRCVETI